MSWGSIFSTDPQPYDPNAEEEDPNDPLKQQQPVLNPGSAGNAGPPPAPVAPLPPIQSSGGVGAQGVAQEFGQSVQPDPSLAAQLVYQNGAPATYGPQITPLMQAAQNVGGNGALGALGPVGDVASKLMDVPFWNTVPGGQLVNSGLQSLGVNPGDSILNPTYNTDIPVVSPIMRDTVQPFAGDVGAVTAQALDPWGIGNALTDRLGAPSPSDVGRFIGQGATPVTFGDFVANAAFGSGPLERITGFPLDNLASNAKGILERAATIDPLAPRALDFPTGRDPRDIISQLRYPSVEGAANIPPGSMYDPLGEPPISSFGNGPELPITDQNARMLGGEVAPTQGVVAPAYSESVPTPRALDPLDPYDTGKAFGYNPASPDYTQFPSRPAIETPPPAPNPVRQEPLSSIISRADSGDPAVTTAYLQAVAKDRGIDIGDIAPGRGAKANIVERLRSEANPPEPLTGGGQATGPNAASPPPASPEIWMNPEQAATARDAENAARDAYIAKNPPSSDPRIEQAIAGDPGLSPAQADFLRSPSGRAAAEQRLSAIDAGFNPGDAAALPGAASGTPPGGGATNAAGAAGGVIPTNAQVTQTAQQTAQQMGVNPNLADRVVQNWLDNSKLTQDYVPSQNQMAKIATTVEHAVTGNFSDSFVSGLVQRQSDLEQALSKVKGLTPTEIQQRVNQAISTRMAEHYQGDATKIAAAQKVLAAADTRAKELAKDFKGLNTFWERTKNTLFPIDIGFFGQNILTGMRQQGVPTLVGMGNRVAMVFHMPFAANLDSVTGIPRMLAAANDGVHFGREASGLSKGSGTLLSYIPGIKAIDKHAIQPVLDALTDAQFKGMGGFLKMMNHEGGLAIAQALGKDIADPAVRRDVASVVNNAWSSARTATTPGRAQLEKLSFTSPAFTRSQLGQITDMAKLITPGASETQRIMAATAVLSNVAMVLGVYKFLNDKVGLTEGEMDPTKPGFGMITLPTTDSNGRHQVVNLFPQRSFQTATVRAIDAIQKGDPGALAEAGAKLAAGRSGALPSAAVRIGLGAGYDTNGQFKTGGMSWEERIKASLPVPVSLQNIAFGQATDPVTMAAELGGVPNYPESKTSEAFRDRADAAQVRTQALNDPELLSRAFPNHPEIAQDARGSEWASRTPQEKQAILAALPPDQAAILKQADEISAAANVEKPTAIGNQIAAQGETDKAIAGIRDEYGKAFEDIGKRLETGQGDPRVLRETLTGLREQMNADIQKAYAGPPPTVGSVVGDVLSQSQRIPNDAQEALSLYNKIGDHIPLVDGKPNYTAIAQAKDAFILDLYRSSPVTASRVDFGLQERKDAAHERNVPIIQFWDDKIKPAVSAYFDVPEGGRTAWRREHPMEDALLTFGGYMPSTASPAAKQILSGLAPGRK